MGGGRDRDSDNSKTKPQNQYKFSQKTTNKQTNKVMKKSFRPLEADDFCQTAVLPVTFTAIHPAHTILRNKFDLEILHN